MKKAPLRVLFFCNLGIYDYQNERGSANRTEILTNYENFPPQYRHASGNFA